MMRHGKGLRLCRMVAGLAAASLVLVGCTGGNGGPDDKPTTAAPTPAGPEGECGTFRIAYDPTNGYEASAFIVGTLAETELDCKVEYVKTTSRKAWRVVARGDADVYLDAYGADDLREKLAGDDGPVTVVGPNGIQGGVDLLAPEFMGDRGLVTSQDLPDTARIGWGSTTPTITTAPELVQLARAFVDFQKLSYGVRDIKEVNGGGMGLLLQLPREDNELNRPNVYLTEGPRPLLGGGDGRQVIDIPESAADPCVPDARTTLCSLGDFRYEKIVNSEFAASDSPAYSLVFDYRLRRADAATIIELVTLSGYDVGSADVASWLNTHESTWKRWLG